MTSNAPPPPLQPSHTTLQNINNSMISSISNNNNNSSSLTSTTSSSARTRRIVWSPSTTSHENMFIVGSFDLRLYAYSPLPVPAANLIAVNSDVSLMKCFAWCPDPVLHDLVAVGLTNGRTTLLRLLQQTSSSSGTTSNAYNYNPDVPSAVAEFIPKHSRACNVISFSSSHPNILATGLDKVRNDNSLLLWDINHSTPNNNNLSRPILQYGASEAVTSISWYPQLPGIIAAGMGLKWIRIFDTRSYSSAAESSPALVTATRSVYGIHVDPFNSYRFASLSEDGLINVWDMRKLSESLLSIAEDRALTRIAFSPTKRDLLASLARESSHVNLFDLRSSFSSHASHHSNQPASIVDPPSLITTAFSAINLSSSHENLDTMSSSSNPSWLPDGSDIHPVHLWRSRKTTTSTDSLASFCWVPTKDNSLALVTRSGSIQFCKLYEPPRVSWSRRGLFSPSFPSNLKDDDQMIRIMLTRARNGYGLASCELNLKLSEEKSISEAWHYIDRMEKLLLTGITTANGKDYSYQSFCSIISDWLKSHETYLNSDETLPPSNLVEMEALLFNICGFDLKSVKTGQHIEEFIKRGQLTRAAAWLVFEHNFKQAALILSSSADEDGVLRLIATILSGIKSIEDCTTEFQLLCNSLSDQLISSQDPYLWSVFSYLGSQGSFEKVLRSSKLEIWERVLIAIRFTPNDQLESFILKTTNDLIHDGNLKGLAFTGLTTDGLRLMQNYVEKTGDFQTTALLSSFFPYKMFKSIEASYPDMIKKVREWTEKYRDVLDRWEMFNERCKFDIARRQRFRNEMSSTTTSPTSARLLVTSSMVDKSEEDDLYEVPSQVYVRCNYCNQPIGQQYHQRRTGGDQHSQVHDRTNSGTASGYNVQPALLITGNIHPSQKVKRMACQSCKKPLPKCSICLLHMETPNMVDMNKDKKTSIDWWFTWCQRCKHGGHSVHLSMWFERHEMCPVSGCECCCYKSEKI